MNTKTQMRNPEKWIGKKVAHLDWEHHFWVYGKCDNCQRFYNHNDLSEFLYPQCEADFVLQDKLHIEEAQTFCQACTIQISGDADRIDPEWQEQHGY